MSQILHSADLLHVASKFTEKKGDGWKGRIHLKVEGDSLITLATDGVVMFRSEGFFDHTLEKTGHHTIDPQPYLKKPPVSKGFHLVETSPVKGSLPFDPFKVDAMSKEIGHSNVDPSRMAHVMKAVSHLTNRVQIHTGKNLTTFTVVGGILPIEIRTQAFVANLSVKT